MESANLVEIFSSFQGEGPHVGCSTLFVRFGECDLRCRWCDSPHTWKPATYCRIEDRAAEERVVQNPVRLAEITAASAALGVERHRFASLTGGEPLLQPDAVRAVAEALRARGPRILLETHGLATAALERTIDVIDVVSMDWKLTSEVARAGAPRGAREEFHAEHAAFVRVALRAPEVYVKVVVTPATRDDELDALARHLAAVDPAVPVVIQPVTPRGPVKESPGAAQLLAWQARLEQSLRDVRVIPQTHPGLGVR
ncbi:MAG: 7-carboxy-7-deazaguanine synthase QueE [Deltaproteobacteria bacterium]|nr:MAG: 7-carboxy-7-deazaguanine synthase QueE [Deltaproteobacteria bacterium]